MLGDTFQAVIVGADPGAALLSGAGELLAMTFSSLTFRETEGSLSVRPLEQSDWRALAHPAAACPVLLSCAGIIDVWLCLQCPVG